MPLGPRLDLRQSQALVVTPQLRQAIKLLQSSNLEVSAFVAEELERNPLLERDDREPPGPDAGPRDGRVPALPEGAPLDRLARAEALPSEAAAPLDVADWSNVYDAAEPPTGRGGVLRSAGPSWPVMRSAPSRDPPAKRDSGAEGTPEFPLVRPYPSALPPHSGGCHTALCVNDSADRTP